MVFSVPVELGYVTTATLAGRLGVSTETVVRMIECGEVAAIRPRPGGHYRIKVEEAERVVREALLRAAALA